jgi:hypothetical protein
MQKRQLSALREMIQKEGRSKAVCKAKNMKRWIDNDI